jgi:hypothetical protein
MKIQFKTLMFAGLIAIMFGSMLQAEERDRNGTVRGMFVRLTERKVGDQGYMGIVVKPFDSDNPVTVLVPRNRKEIVQTARRMEEGTRLGISFVIEDGHKFIRGIEAELRREKREKRPEGEGQITIRREIRREPSESDQRPESRRMRNPRRDPEPERPRGREERPDRRPAAHLDHLQRQLREVVSGHLDRMSRSLREVMADHLWRMDSEFRELRNRVDRIERELDQLRAENERLRRELRERTGSRRENEEQARERRDNRNRDERDVNRNREQTRDNTRRRD